MKVVFILLISLNLAPRLSAQNNASCCFKGWQVQMAVRQQPFLKAFSVEAKDNEVQIRWLAGGLSAGGMYIVEKAVSGQDFRQITVKRVLSLSIPLDISFSVADTVASGLVRYRLVYIAADGSRIEYETVEVRIPAKRLRERLGSSILNGCPVSLR